MHVNYLTNAEYFGHQAVLGEGIYQEKHNNAKKMLQRGADYAFIAEVTGLSEEELKVLQ